MPEFIHRSAQFFAESRIRPRLQQAKKLIRQSFRGEIVLYQLFRYPFLRDQVDQPEVL